MNKAQMNATFLSATDGATKAAILANIAKHYDITSAEAYAEVTGEDAEPLPEYMTGPARVATSLLMATHSLRKEL